MPTQETIPAERADRYSRTDDPETSVAAAAGISEKAMTRLQSDIRFIFYSVGPMTDEMLYRQYLAYGVATRKTGGYPYRTAQRVRTARSEMTEGSKHQIIRARIRATDQTKPTASGYQSTVWELIPGEEI